MSATSLNMQQDMDQALADQADEQFAQLSALRPRLRQDIRIREQSFRGAPWWIVEDDTSTQVYRLDEAAFSLVSQLNGSLSVGDIYTDVAKRFNFSEQDAAFLIGQLQRADLIQLATVTVEDPSLILRQKSAASGSVLKSLKNPLSIRVPLWDPDRFLTACQSASQFFATAAFRIIALVVAFFAGLILLQQFPALVEYGVARSSNLSSLIFLLCVYPLVKIVHEFAHAASIKYYAGEVHEMGVMFLVFMPVPYVDASASAAFEDKNSRMVVSAAGIVAELLLAALAIIVWANVHSGFISDLAFSIALIGGFSTLLFNGNPLLRFDGYFVFSDWLEMPNLASRARGYWLYLVRRYLFGVAAIVSPVTAQGERRWLLSYGFFSTTYRLFILTSICLFLAATIPLLGLLLAAWAIFNQLLLPVAKSARYLVINEELQATRVRAISSTFVILLVVGAFISGVPISNWSRAEGLVRLPESSQLRAAEAGFVKSVFVVHGQHVSAGQPIAQLESISLDAEHERLVWRLDELEARKAMQLVASPVDAAMLNETIENIQALLRDTKEKLAALQLVAPISGTVELLETQDWLGRYIEQGTSFAHVLNDDTSRVIVVVPQAAIADIRNEQTTVVMRSSGRANVSVPAKMVSITPAGTRELPNAALGSQRGGAVAVDSRVTDGRRSLEQVFQLELAPLDPGTVLQPGTRMVVRFEHAEQNIFSQSSDAVRRLLMTELDW